MLLYTVQLAGALTRSLLRPRLGALGESRLARRVWPHDLDTNGHMNNGRYLTHMDFGRFDLVVRNGMGRVVLENRWRPIVASLTIRYRRPLLLLDRFELATRAVCWDERWFYLQQRFYVAGELAASAIVRGSFRDRAGMVPAPKLMELVGVDPVSPPMPDAIRRWQDAESLTRGAAI